jgi:hypothetical protein
LVHVVLEVQGLLLLQVVLQGWVWLLVHPAAAYATGRLHALLLQM